MPRQSAQPGVAQLLLPALWSALAAWLSIGTIGFQSANGERIGLLPLSAVAIVTVVAAAAGVLALVRLGAPRTPLSLLLLAVLPWVPGPVPAAFLIWSGPASAMVWIAVVLMMWRGLPNRVRWRSPLVVKAPVQAGLCALLLFGAAAWRATPTLSGDEPHYLVITQSLLLDGDIDIRNNHRRHDYQSFYQGELAPHFQRLGRNGAMYSVHAPGISALVLPAFAVAGYRGVVVLLVVVGAAGTAVAWWVAWLATKRTDAAWFAWAVVTLPVTAVFNSFTVYPDGTGGVLPLTGLWALLRADEERRSGAERMAPWFWHGVALATLPWLHSRFAVIAGGFGAVILLRLASTRRPATKAVAFLVVPAVSAMLWLGFFIALYGTPDPSAPYSAGELGSIQWIPGGLTGLLFDQRFGLLPYAPVVAFALAGVVMMLVRSEYRRLGIEGLFVAVPYLLTVTHFAMWWGGLSAPARFAAPVLPLLAVPAAVCWVGLEGRRERTLAVAALAFTGFATAVLVTVDRGRLAYNLRDTPALWLEWLSRPADLARAMPWWTRGGDLPFFADVAIWLAAAAGVVLVVRAAGSALADRTAVALAYAWALAAAAMVASSAVWVVRGVDGHNVVGGQLGLLRGVAETPHAAGLDLSRLRAIQPSAVPRRVRIELSRPLSDRRGASRDTRPLFDIPRVPAGEYSVTPVARDPRGWLMVGIGSDQFSLVSGPLASPPQSVHLRFPMTVRNISVRGDEDAHQSVSGLILEPIAVMPAGRWGAETGRRAVKYGGSTVFFLDDRSFPEPEGFWLGGRRSSSIVVQADDSRPVLTMMMRNGPVANHATVDVAGARTELEFGPGEERQVSIPVDASRGAAHVTVSVTGGFRPSEQDPASRDTRFLGIWVKPDQLD
jgi:hypothetical protein